MLHETGFGEGGARPVAQTHAHSGSWCAHRRGGAGFAWRPNGAGQSLGFAGENRAVRNTGVVELSAVPR